MLTIKNNSIIYYILVIIIIAENTGKVKIIKICNNPEKIKILKLNTLLYIFNLCTMKEKLIPFAIISQFY